MSGRPGPVKPISCMKSDEIAFHFASDKMPSSAPIDRLQCHTAPPVTCTSG